jgi:hypothetical protein
MRRLAFVLLIILVCVPFTLAASLPEFAPLVATARARHPQMDWRWEI